MGHLTHLSHLTHLTHLTHLSHLTHLTHLTHLRHLSYLIHLSHLSDMSLSGSLQVTCSTMDDDAIFDLTSPHHDPDSEYKLHVSNTIAAENVADPARREARDPIS